MLGLRSKLIEVLMLEQLEKDLKYFSDRGNQYIAAMLKKRIEQIKKEADRGQR